MALRPWDERLFGTTRTRIVMLLRRANYTVSELAVALGLSNSGVRAHLATLERIGLVRQAELRRGERKPSHTYTLTPEAELLFPKAYGLVLRHVLDVFGEHFGEQQVETGLREVGRRMAATHDLRGTNVDELTVGAATLLDALGGLTEVVPANGGYLIQGSACPLADTSATHPEMCQLVETLLAEATGASVRERCDRSNPPRCRFEMTVHDD